MSANIDYLLLRGCDRRHIKNIIAAEECVSHHRLLVGDVVISSAPRKKKKKRMHIPRLKVWKLREPNVKQEFARLVTDRKDGVFEADNVESKWNAMKEVWQKATEQVCGWTKGPLRQSETWCWDDEVAKAIEEKRRCYKIGIKPKQQVIGISIKRQDEMQGEMLFLHRKRQGKSLLMSWRVQQDRKMSTELQSKWQNPGRM